MLFQRIFSRKLKNFIYNKYINYNQFWVRNMEGDIKIRANPIVKKLDTPEFNSIFTPELKVLIDLFAKYKYEIRIAGGAVRDLLMGKIPKDVDFATTATPEQMKDMFTTEDIRMINTKGEKHGTITPRINDKENFEVTTLRIDVITDGRHAEVKFTTDWLLDASRRDLTINSMFLGSDGSIYDYFYGCDDLEARRISFVGNADTRIKEDFLRILRYFRFYGRIADKPDCHNDATISAIKTNADGLAIISGERIWSELKKIIEGKHSIYLILKMLDCNLGKYIGLPESPNLNEFKRVALNNEKFHESHKQNAICMLTALLNTPDDAIDLHNRLKFSRFQRDLCFFLVANREETENVENILDFKKLCLKPNIKHEYILELLKYHGRVNMYDEFQNWKMPAFVLSGDDLVKHGCPSGPAIGLVSTKLKQIWANDNFQTSSEDLVNVHLTKVLEKINSDYEQNKKIKFK